MSSFHSGSRSGGRRNFGGRDSNRPSMHDAVCDDCGNDCKVPFRPSGDKPIYCSDCFEKKGGRDGGRSRGGGNPSTDKLVKNIEILNTKLDSIISLLSLPKKKKSKPVKVEVKKKKAVKSVKVE